MSEELSAYQKKRKQKKIARNGFLAVLILALMSTAAYFIFTRYLVVKEVVIQETTLYSQEEMLDVCAVEKQTPLIALSKKEICRAVEENFPYLVNVKVEFDLPGKVLVGFREDFGMMALQLGTELFSLDRELNVLAKEPHDSTIPRISLLTEDVSRCVVGEKLSFFDPAVATAISDLITALEKKEMLSDVNVFDLRDKLNIKVHYQSRFELLMGENSDLGYKFAMVQEVIKDLGAEERGRIDITDPNTAYVKLTPDVPQ